MWSGGRTGSSVLPLSSAQLGDHLLDLGALRPHVPRHHLQARLFLLQVDLGLHVVQDLVVDLDAPALGVGDDQP